MEAMRLINDDRASFFFTGKVIWIWFPRDDGAAILFYINGKQRGRSIMSQFDLLKIGWKSRGVS